MKDNNIALLTTKTCSKCPMVKSMIESKGLDIEYIDIEETPDIAIESEVMSVPTIVVYENTEEPFNILEKHVGQGACMELVSQLSKES